MFVIIKENNLSIRYLRQNDQYLLAQWLSDPSVLEYYEGRDNLFDLERVNQKFYRKNDNNQRCIIEYDGIPIGYMQFYKADAKDDYNANEVTYGMDQFIGETGYWNKGIGTLMMSSMVAYLVEKRRALKCYEKCGFKKVALLPKHELHEGIWRDCWLMEYRIY